MKKILAVILVLLVLLVTVSACVELDPITILKEKLSQTTKATMVVHTIEVLAGTQQLSLQKDTYTVGGDSVTLSSTLTQLNPDYVSDGQKLVTTTQTETLTTEQFQQKIPHTINFTMESLVAESYSATANGSTVAHTMEILPQCFSQFLSITQQQANTISNLQVTVLEFDEIVTSIKLSYTSNNGNQVTITYSFTY